MHFSLLWVFFEKIGASLLSVVVFFVYAKVLSPEEFGVAVVILSVTQFLAILLTTFFEDVLVQKKDVNDQEFATTFWASLLASLLLTALCALGFYYASVRYDHPQLFSLALFAVLEIPVTNLAVSYVAQCRRDGKFKLLAVRVLIGRVGGALVGLACVLGGLGGAGIVAQSVVGATLQTVILLCAARSLPRFRMDTAYLRRSLTFGSLLAMRRLSWDFLVRITPVIAGAVGGAAMAGVVGFAWRIVELLRSAIASGLSSYTLPLLSRQQHDLPSMRRSYEVATGLVAFFATPIFLGLFLVTPTMIVSFFDPKWQATIPLIQLFCLTALLSLYRFASPLCMTAAGRPGAMLHVDIISVTLATLAMYYFGSAGAWVFGAVHLARMVVTVPVGTRLLQRVIGIPVRSQWVPVFKFMLPGLVMFGVMLLARETFTDVKPWLALTLQVVGGMAVFSAVSVVFYRGELRSWKEGVTRQ